MVDKKELVILELKNTKNFSVAKQTHIFLLHRVSLGDQQVRKEYGRGVSPCKEIGYGER